MRRDVINLNIDWDVIVACKWELLTQNLTQKC